MLLVAIPDFDDIRINKVTPRTGAWPPPQREVLLERSSVAMVGARVGDHLLIETPDGKQRRMRVAGTVHDLSQIASFFRGIAYGYISSTAWSGSARRAISTS